MNRASRRAIVARAAIALLVAAGTVLVPGRAVPASTIECGDVSPVATSPSPYEAGKLTPIVLVHGFTGSPAMWDVPTAYSSFTPSQRVTNGISLQTALGRLPGAAVYLVDYRTSNATWFAEPGGGGEEFLRVVDCVLAREEHQGHKFIVVAHSMGGLIARWALTDAPGAEQRRARAGLMVTLGTPYDGSFVAAAADWLMESAELVAATTPTGRAGLTVLHVLAVLCARLGRDVAVCREVAAIQDYLTAVRAFQPGSAELTELSPWPASVPVHTLTARTVLSDTHGLFRKRTTEHDLGDLVVGVGSATAGDHPEKIAECRYTVDGLTAAANSVLDDFGMRLNDDPSGFVSLSGLLGACFHTHEAQLVELHAETLGLVAEHLSRPQTPAALVGYIQAGAYTDPAPFTEYITTFKTPSGNIGCAIVSFNEPHVLCHIGEYSFPTPSGTCDSPFNLVFDPNWISASRSGVRQGGCFGGLPFDYFSARTLPYGSTISDGTVACRSESAFLACAMLATGQGFILSRESVSIYGDTLS